MYSETVNSFLLKKADSQVGNCLNILEKLNYPINDQEQFTTELSNQEVGKKEYQALIDLLPITSMPLANRQSAFEKFYHNYGSQLFTPEVPDIDVPTGSPILPNAAVCRFLAEKEADRKAERGTLLWAKAYVRAYIKCMHRNYSSVENLLRSGLNLRG